MVTRKDVARRAHVSTATVSNVINNKPGVSQDLRDRVWKAIEELGYRPNLIARSLKTRQSRQIALVTNGISNPYFAEVARGMEKEAYEEGYMISILNARADEGYIDQLIMRQFDGIILDTDKIPVEQVNRLAKYHLPTVFIGNEGYSGFDQEIIFVNIDLYAGAVKLFEYLIKCGHRRIGFLSARKLGSFREPDYRLKAYREVLKKHSIEFDPSIVFIDGDTPEYAYLCTCRMLSMENRPTAIFTGNDYLSQSVYAAAANFGLSIPGDLSVAGFDNLNASRYMVPPLTTVAVPNFELGKTVIHLLLERMKGRQVDNINMETRLVLRQSVKKIAE